MYYVNECIYFSLSPKAILDSIRNLGYYLEVLDLPMAFRTRLHVVYSETWEFRETPKGKLS